MRLQRQIVITKGDFSTIDHETGRGICFGPKRGGMEGEREREQESEIGKGEKES